MTNVSRHFVRCGDRLVHLRRAGSGPPVLLLHESPSSSKMMLPLMEALAPDCTVIAPDTPGNGLSDPLPQETPAMADYAEALVELLDALGIRRVAALGLHTGGGCLVELAARSPERLTVAVIGGLVAFSPASRDELLARYFIDLSPEDSGAHMLRAWQRMRGQFMHFPWYDKRPETRMRVDLPATEAIDGMVMDLLLSARSYRAPYSAAIAHNGASRLAAARAPVAISATRQDGIYSHIETLPDGLASKVTVAHFDTFPEARAWQLEQLRARLPTEPAPAAPVSAWIDGCSALRLGPGGDTHALAWGRAGGRPLVLLHAAGASSSQWTMAAPRLAQERPVLALDLPGHGHSEAGDEDLSFDGVADHVERVIDQLGWSNCALYGEGLGARLAARCVEHGRRGDRQLVPGPPLDPLVPDQTALQRCRDLLAPRPWGEHLVAAWHIARDAALFARWDTPQASAVLNGDGAALAPEVVQQRALGLLLARPFLGSGDWPVSPDGSARSAGSNPAALPSYGHAGQPDWLAAFNAVPGSQVSTRE